MSRRPTSLQRQLIFRQLLLQFVALAASAVGFIIFFVNSDLDGMYVENTVVDIAAQSIVRDANGTPTIRPTEEFLLLLSRVPDLWFAVKLDDGTALSFGRIPTELASIVTHLDEISSADLRGAIEPYSLSAIVRQASGPSGPMKIIAHGAVRPFTALITIASNIVALAIFLILALISVVATPIFVRKSLKGVVKVAHEAERIDADRRETRLSEINVPREIGPLVRAINDALDRLDKGYDRQNRFIAAAAHELRTPIAILRLKIEVDDNEKLRSLLPDALRLATLSEQLLDLHRLESGAPHGRLDLGLLAQACVGDLAPFVIARGKVIELTVEKPSWIVGNVQSIERALSNLIQNAVDHGGQKIVVRVNGAALEVEDNGAGLSHEERERILEPFHRVRPSSSGAGLGLSLVKQVMDHHRGHIAIQNAAAGGMLVRLEFHASD